MKNFKKFFGMFLALCMVVGTLTTAYADDGSYESPWQLSTSSIRFYVYVAPGETQYVQVDDCNGTTVEVGYATSMDYMIQYGKLNSYYPENEEGQLSFTLQEGGDIFSVYNSGEDYVSVYMSLVAGAPADTTGTMNDPEEIVLGKDWFGNIAGESQHTFETGDEGYFYYVTAPADGVLSIGTYGAYDDDFNSVGWMYNVNSMEAKADGTYYYGDTHWSDDEEPVMFEELKVSEGEKYVVCMNTYDPNAFGAVAGTMSLKVSFSPVGSYGCPDTAETGTTKYPIEAGSMGYYVNWTATEAGSAIINVSGENGWQYSVSGTMADGTYYYGDTHWSDDDPVVATESVAVKKGDVLTIFVNTYDAETYSAVEGTVTLDITFLSAAAEEEVSVSEKELDKVIADSEYEGLEENVYVGVSSTFGQNVVSIKGYEATILKDVAYVALDFAFVDVDGYPAYVTEGATANVKLAVDSVLADAKNVDVYVLDSITGELTKLTSCEVTEGKIAFEMSKEATYVFVDVTVEEEPSSDENVSGGDDTKVDEDVTTEEETTTGEANITTPNTGDSSNVSMMLLLAAAAVIGGIFVMNTKRKEA